MPNSFRFPFRRANDYLNAYRLPAGKNALSVLESMEFNAALTPVSGSLSATLGDLTLSATGSLAVIGGVNGSLSSTFDGITLSSSSVLALRGALSVTFGDLTTSSSGTVGISGQSGATFGDLTLSSAGQIAPKGSLNASIAGLTLSSTGSLQSTAIAGQLTTAFDGLSLVATGTIVTDEQVLGGKLKPKVVNDFANLKNLFPSPLDRNQLDDDRNRSVDQESVEASFGRSKLASVYKPTAQEVRAMRDLRAALAKALAARGESRPETVVFSPSAHDVNPVIIQLIAELL